MVNVVLGIGTSHSPMLAIDPALWLDRAQDDVVRDSLFLADGRVVPYAQLLRESDGKYAAVATPEIFADLDAKAQRALDRLAAVIAAANLDALVVIGDDQQELFSGAHVPAIAIYTGSEIVTHPKNEVTPNLPTWYQEANRGYLMDTIHRHPAAPELAAALVDGLIGVGVDLAVATDVNDPDRAGFGHAFGFVIERFCTERAIPILPVLLNTYFPPNVPRPGRCWDIGELIGRTLAEISGDQRVGIVASGGLSHFAVDEDLDRKVLAALKNRDADTLRSLSPASLRSGNSEILNWIMTAGALSGLEVTDEEYIPVHRTPAGTGVGLGFLTWRRIAELDRSTV